MPVRVTVELADPFSVNEQPGTCRSAGLVGVTAHVRETVPLSPMELIVMGLVADWPGAGMLRQVPANPLAQLGAPEGIRVNPSLVWTLTVTGEVVDEPK